MRSFEIGNDSESEVQTGIDVKVVKTHYPKCNNANIFEIILERDPNLALVKSQIEIHMIIEIDEGYCVENGLASKLFKALNIEIESQSISTDKSE